ncbi:MAG TPA: NADP-dependent malic enzyme [Burkholderiaceae bacterium]|nr:NADP-dependent malic enzyme [Burkholderiaceae bacterium]
MPDKEIREASLEYHRLPTPGKIALTAPKQLTNQRDLALAYTPGVAAVCDEIVRDPREASNLTARGNLVAVVTNGTAVLGLGAIGPLAAKPVMECKAVLFKKSAGLDCFDIELNERDPDKLVDMIVALEPTFGGINLEDIKAPECFYIEQKLRERLNIPVFHDDQHGTAIISGSALLNGLELVGKQIGEVKLVVSGAGAAAIACVDLMVELGISRANVFMCDSKGVIYEGRPGGFDASKARYAQRTEARTLADAVKGADVFLGCSTAGVLTGEMVKTMGRQPVILALANPEPEIRPEEALAARPDAIVATGRSDYPNQVNNVLCFPYIFRGALDCGATKITEAMKLACVREIAELAKAEISDEVAAAYPGQELHFGPEYLIPKPFDSRLILRISPAVARAAEASGVATRPIQDYEAYQDSLKRYMSHTGMFMRPVFATAKAAPDAAKRVVFAEGEDERVLRAVQAAIDEHMVQPILIGRPAVIDERIEKAGLHIHRGKDFECVDPINDPRVEAYGQAYHRFMAREGVAPRAARAAVHRSSTILGAMMVREGHASALICGTLGRFDQHLDHVRDVIGVAPGCHDFATMNALMLEQHTLFIADTYVNENPSAEDLAEIAHRAAEEVWRFGITPKVAFLSHSVYGSSKRPSALKMRRARDLFVAAHPQIECDGELHGDAALSEDIRGTYMSESTLHGSANVLICPNIDAANILFNVIKVTSAGNVTVGPILLGAAKPVHVLTPSATVRRLVNMTALAVADAAEHMRA